MSCLACLSDDVADEPPQPLTVCRILSATPPASESCGDTLKCNPGLRYDSDDIDMCGEDSAQETHPLGAALNRCDLAGWPAVGRPFTWLAEGTTARAEIHRAPSATGAKPKTMFSARRRSLRCVAPPAPDIRSATTASSKNRSARGHSSSDVDTAHGALTLGVNSPSADLRSISLASGCAYGVSGGAVELCSLPLLAQSGISPTLPLNPFPMRTEWLTSAEPGTRDLRPGAGPSGWNTTCTTLLDHSSLTRPSRARSLGTFFSNPGGQRAACRSGSESTLALPASLHSPAHADRFTENRFSMTFPRRFTRSTAFPRRSTGPGRLDPYAVFCEEQRHAHGAGPDRSHYLNPTASLWERLTAHAVRH